MHLTGGTCSDNYSKIQDKKYCHAENLDDRSNVFIPSKPFGGETEKRRCGEDEESNWKGQNCAPLTDLDSLNIRHTASGTTSVHWWTIKLKNTASEPRTALHPLFVFSRRAQVTLIS